MFNQVAISGRLTADPDYRTTQTGKHVCYISLANEQGYKDKKKTHFIDCVAWEGTADILQRYFHKGSMCGVMGTLIQDSYKDVRGNNITRLKVLAREVVFMDSKSSAAPTVPTETPVVSQGNQADFLAIDADDDLPF